jgi:hypothetical protein
MTDWHASSSMSMLVRDIHPRYTARTDSTVPHYNGKASTRKCARNAGRRAADTRTGATSVEGTELVAKLTTSRSTSGLPISRLGQRTALAHR